MSNLLILFNMFFLYMLYRNYRVHSYCMKLIDDISNSNNILIDTGKYEKHAISYEGVSRDQYIMVLMFWVNLDKRLKNKKNVTTEIVSGVIYG